jgi:hypothetical protein
MKVIADRALLAQIAARLSAQERRELKALLWALVALQKGARLRV